MNSHHPNAIDPDGASAIDPAFSWDAARRFADQGLWDQALTVGERALDVVPAADAIRKLQPARFNTLGDWALGSGRQNVAARLFRRAVEALEAGAPEDFDLRDLETTLLGLQASGAGDAEGPRLVRAHENLLSRMTASENELLAYLLARWNLEVRRPDVAAWYLDRLRRIRPEGRAWSDDDRILEHRIRHEQAVAAQESAELAGALRLIQRASDQRRSRALQVSKPRKLSDFGGKEDWTWLKPSQVEEQVTGFRAGTAHEWGRLWIHWFPGEMRQTLAASPWAWAAVILIPCLWLTAVYFARPWAESLGRPFVGGVIVLLWIWVLSQARVVRLCHIASGSQYVNVALPMPLTWLSDLGDRQTRHSTTEPLAEQLVDEVAPQRQGRHWRLAGTYYRADEMRRWCVRTRHDGVVRMGLQLAAGLVLPVVFVNLFFGGMIFDLTHAKGLLWSPAIALWLFLLLASGFGTWGAWGHLIKDLVQGAWGRHSFALGFVDTRGRFTAVGTSPAEAVARRALDLLLERMSQT